MERTKPTRDFYFPNIEDKLAFLLECICEVESQLKQRHAKKADFLNQIDEKLCEVQTNIYALEQCNPDIANRQKSTLEKEIQILEKEKRQHEIECWRDISTLQRELRELKRQYRTVKAGCLMQKN